MTEPKPKPRLLNISHTKVCILGCAAANRPKFTRVNLDFLLRVAAQLKGFIRNEVRRHPSIGKTLK